MNIGGHASDMKQHFSFVQTEESRCHMKIPLLPTKFLIDPMVGSINDTLLVCSIDYDKYRLFRDKRTKCWMLKLSRRLGKRWIPVASPPHSLFLSSSASSSSTSEILMVGGSREMTAPDQYHLMSGSRFIQKFNIKTRTWSQGPLLPAPLFEGCSVETPDGLVAIGDFEEGEPNAYIQTSGMWNELPLSNFQHTNPSCVLTNINNKLGVVVISGNRVEMLNLSDKQWFILPKPNINRAPEVKPTLGLSLGKLVLSGGVDLYSGDISNVVEEWDENKQLWRISSGSVGLPTIRQGNVMIPVRFMDYCDILE